MNEPELVDSRTAVWRPGGRGQDAAVLVSGGVDSAVALATLRDQGWTVAGLTMLLPAWTAAGERPPATGAEAARICELLAVPHFTLDLRESFAQLVLDPFRVAYRSGLTPSPCVECNPRLKFGLVWDLARRSLGVSHLATGHYVRRVESGGRPGLARAADRRRDQSYFLYRLPAQILPHLLFPLGKTADKLIVRDLARKLGLPAAEQGDSQDLCFLPEGDYRILFGGELGRPGPIEDAEGRRLGEHQGLGNYTLGQRRGLGVAVGRPAYVVGLDRNRNAVILGPRELAQRRVVTARDLNLHFAGELAPGARIWARIRSSSEPQSATVQGCDGDSLSVEFAQPVFAPAAGQHLVAYSDAGRLLGGGRILSAQ